jgi:hypothetical protein
MNNEPVAWMDEINTFVLDKDYQQFPKSLQHGMIPLYSHPVKDKPHPKCDEACMYLCQMRELTDEEIKDFIATFPIIFTPDDLVIFARAILRKASEK